jgi:hypothetical protein
VSENEAKGMIISTVEDIVKGERVETVSRKPMSTLEHQVIFAVVFRHDEAKELEVIEAIKKLTFNEPDIGFGGTEVDDKFNMEYVAVLVTATIK